MKNATKVRGLGHRARLRGPRWPLRRGRLWGVGLLVATIWVGSVSAAGQTASADALLNPNTATEEQLQKIEPLGAAVTEIVKRRPFKSITEVTAILKQQGLTQDQITEVYRKMFIPINLNTASDEEILSIPGIGKRMLHEFKEYRPYKAIEQFRREIGKYVDKQEVARLEKYVTL
jgi:DNA uptake protein ComE-like DNA-binding protein